VILCAAELWNLLTFGMARGIASASPALSDGVTMVKSSEVPESPLANQALLLVLVLANHCTGDKNLHNPYRQALFSCSNSQGNLLSPFNMLIGIAQVCGICLCEECV
jgi:hypothetical protein